MKPLLDPTRIASYSGFGMSSRGDGYSFRPSDISEIGSVWQVARESGRKVVLRGGGRSYGDAALADEAIVLDMRRMNRVISWDPQTGILDVEAGVTIADIWRHTLEDGWWPPVVSGTMFPTIGGACAMNIHGKNAYKVGPLGEHVLAVDVMLPTGETVTLTPQDPRFRAVISGAGLLGVIVAVRLQMKRVRSGNVRVLPISVRSWEEQFEVFEQYRCEADYLVSWVDAFARFEGSGRGLIHAAWHCEESDPSPVSLQLDHQELPDTILGLIPKSSVWRMLKPLSNRFGMKVLNGMKHRSAQLLGNGVPHEQSLAAFSFLLDYVPNWQNVYLPHGFIQYQAFVPEANARLVFDTMLFLARKAGMEPFLAVLKRHREDGFLFSHGVEGYSLALDFKIRDRDRLWRMCGHFSDMVLEADGKFYLAKDSTLRREDLEGWLGEVRLAEFARLRSEMDPEGMLTSALAQRLSLA